MQTKRGHIYIQPHNHCNLYMRSHFHMNVGSRNRMMLASYLKPINSAWQLQPLTTHGKIRKFRSLF